MTSSEVLIINDHLCKRKLPTRSATPLDGCRVKKGAPFRRVPHLDGCRVCMGAAFSWGRFYMGTTFTHN